MSNQLCQSHNQPVDLKVVIDAATILTKVTLE
jgi:hypothetical protein